MSKIVMTAVDSSNISRVGFNPSAFTLTVEFRNGNLYRYSQVNAMSYVRLMCAESRGKYFNSYIKPLHPVKKLRVIGGK